MSIKEVKHCKILRMANEKRRQPMRNTLATGIDIEQQSNSPGPDHPWRNYGHKINGKLIHLTNSDILTLP